MPFLGALGRIEASERQALLTAMKSVPQGTSVWRLELLRLFKPSKSDLNRVNIPVLVIASGADRLLPSVLEARFLTQTLPNAQMVVLPDSGHACLLERDTDLYTIIQAYSVAEESDRRVQYQS